MSRRRRSAHGSVHLIASLGGHLELLDAASPAVALLRQTWITSEGARAASLRAQGKRVRILPRLDRSTLGISAVLAGVLLAIRERPALVITSGAGLAVPFTLVSWLLGARVVFVETMARVQRGSMSGRLIARTGARVLVQWPDLRSSYPRAVVCQPLLLEGLPELRADGVGTFVTVGSHDAGFDRMLAAVDAAASSGALPEPVVVQRGTSSYRPQVGTCLDFVTPQEFVTRMAAAAVVVTHGGAGAIATALRCGRRPLVFARDPAKGEHVDGHQQELVDRLSELGLIVQVHASITPEHVASTRGPGPAEVTPIAATTGLPTVVTALSEAIRDQDGRR